MRSLRLVVFLIFFLILFSVFAFADTGHSSQYLSPKPNSTLVSRQTNIIIRPGAEIDRGSLSNSAITVTGSLSGLHSGTILLSDDEKTVLFNPLKIFAAAEKVTVSGTAGLKTTAGVDVGPFNFTFTITPLAKPLSLDATFVDGLEETVSFSAPAVSNSPHNVSTTIDGIPDDFPEITVGVVDNPAPGNIFISNMPGPKGTSGTFVMAIDNDGAPVDYKRVPTMAWDFKVLPNGQLSYSEIINQIARGSNGVIWRVVDSSLAVVDSFQCKNGYTAEQHDFQLLPNGHALLFAYDVQPIDMSQIVAGGRPDATVIGAVIQELDNYKNVVFQWRTWDYIPITDTYANVLAASFDHTHCNSIEMDSDGAILVSFRGLSEVTKISRSTGEIIWRLGGKKNEFTFIGENEANAPLYFSKQHDARRIKNGNITIFDNGSDHAPQYSRAVEYQLDEENKTATLVWEYRHSPDIYTQSMGSMQRLPNGNTLICWGARSKPGFPPVSEVTPDKKTAFELFLPGTENTYRAYRFPWKSEVPICSVTKYEVLEGNTYLFNETDTIITGVTMKVNSFQGENYNQVTVKRTQYAPINPVFPEKAPTILPVRVSVSGESIISINADIYFDALSFGFDNPDTLIVYQREFEGQGMFFPLVTQYNPVKKQLKVTARKFGEFIFGMPDVNSVAYVPMPFEPANETSVNQTLPVTFKWAPKGIVNSHHLQVATDAAFTNVVVNDSTLTESVYTLAMVAENTTYYWRVRINNDAGSSGWSETAVFQTTAPFVSVTVPNVGEEWQRGLSYFIEWDDNITEDIQIELFNADTLFGIIDTTASSGSYSWEIDPYLAVGSFYKIGIRSTTDSSVFDLSDNSFAVIDTTDAAVDDVIGRSVSYQLYQNYPNPFNPATTIAFDLPEAGHVALKIYDVLGQEIAILADTFQRAGRHQYTFNAADIPSGLYFYKIESNNFCQVKKMLLMK